MMLRKLSYLKALTGLFVAFLVYYFAWPFVNGKERMQTFCNATTKGTSSVEMTENARAKGYRVSRSEKEQAIVHDPRTFGRNVCYIVLHQEQVVSTRYGFND
jgi:hypothetical protein